MPSGWTIGHLPVSAGHARLALRSGRNNLCPPKEKSSSKPSWQVICWRVTKTYSNPRDLKEKMVSPLSELILLILLQSWSSATLGRWTQPIHGWVLGLFFRTHLQITTSKSPFLPAAQWWFWLLAGGILWISWGSGTCHLTQRSHLHWAPPHLPGRVARCIPSQSSVVKPCRMHMFKTRNTLLPMMCHR